MANRKAGTAGDGNTGEAKRPAAGKKSAGTAAGGAGAAPGGGAGARKQAATTRSDSTTADTQAAKKTTGGAAKGASKGATKGAAKGAAKGAGAAPAAAGGASAAKAASKRTKAAGQGGGKADLSGDLRRFVDENPHGWGHDQWEGLLGQLRERGHDTSDPDQIGMQLERERLRARLENVQGISKQRAKSLADRFGTLYSLRNADADELAREAKVSRDEAERIKGQLA